MKGYEESIPTNSLINIIGNIPATRTHKMNNFFSQRSLTKKTGRIGFQGSTTLKNECRKNEMQKGKPTSVK